VRGLTAAKFLFKLKKWETARRSKFHGGGVEYFTAAAAYDRRRPCLHRNLNLKLGKNTNRGTWKM
jgi:hypothetical protein